MMQGKDAYGESMKQMAMAVTELSIAGPSSMTAYVGGTLPRQDPKVQGSLKVYKIAGQGGLWTKT